MIDLEFANDVIHLHNMEWQENLLLYHQLEGKESLIVEPRSTYS